MHIVIITTLLVDDDQKIVVVSTKYDYVLSLLVVTTISIISSRAYTSQ